MYKQIIIVRKDLEMSPGKLAAQVSHGSMAFLTAMIKRNTFKDCINQHDVWTVQNGRKIPKPYASGDLQRLADAARERGENYFYCRKSDVEGRFQASDPIYMYILSMGIDADLYEQWICGSFTKCVLEARNKHQLLKAAKLAEKAGMKEGEDFFLIKDNCLTELEPEEVDRKGIGRTLTCIGFRPMEDTVIDQIGKKYQLYK